MENTNNSKFPQWSFNENSVFDKCAKWIDKTFFGSDYNLTTEKVMIVALCTNVFGMHRVYAGRKISAVIGWFLLLLSLASREIMTGLIIPWLVVDFIRIFLGNYGRLKSRQRFDFNKFKALFTYKLHVKNKAISCGVSVLVLLMIASFAPHMDTVSTDSVVSGSDIVVTQTDSATETTTETTTEATTEEPTEATTAAKSKNILMNAKVQECPVMNGTMTKRIGTYAYIRTDKELVKAMCTEEDYIEFLNERVKDSGYNWFTIVFEDDTGIQFAGSIIYQGTYGTLDKERCTKKAIGDVFYMDGKVTYEKR